MSIDNLMVMGAGAVGGYFGGRVARAASAKVTLVARGEHLNAIQREGLVIESEDNRLKVTPEAVENPGDAGSKPDLILFTVKSYDTGAAIRQITPVVSQRTQVLTLQNGIENYPKLVEAFGEDRVIQGFCKIGASVPRPGVVQHSAFGEITLGEQDGSESGRIMEIKSLFEEAGVSTAVSSDITHDVWVKFSWNCLLNMITAAANVTVDKIYGHEEPVALCYRLYEEIQKVAAREGVELTDEEGAGIIESARKLEGFETSTYQDRKKKKKMEYEAFTGAVVRLADKHDLDVPYHQTLYALLKLIDESKLPVKSR